MLDHESISPCECISSEGTLTRGPPQSHTQVSLEGLVTSPPNQGNEGGLAGQGPSSGKGERGVPKIKMGLQQRDRERRHSHGALRGGAQREVLDLCHLGRAPLQLHSVPWGPGNPGQGKGTSDRDSGEARPQALGRPQQEPRLSSLGETPLLLDSSVFAPVPVSPCPHPMPGQAPAAKGQVQVCRAPARRQAAGPGRRPHRPPSAVTCLPAGWRPTMRLCVAAGSELSRVRGSPGPPAVPALEARDARLGWGVRPAQPSGPWARHSPGNTCTGLGAGERAAFHGGLVVGPPASRACGRSGATRPLSLPLDSQESPWAWVN